MEKKKLVWLVVIAALVLSASYEGIKWITAPGKHDDFAKCLSSKGVIMYGTDWCPHCKKQKALFGKSFRYVNYVDCDRNRAGCAGAGITGYPTWVIGGMEYVGTRPLKELSARSGCSLEAK